MVDDSSRFIWIEPTALWFFVVVSFQRTKVRSSKMGRGYASGYRLSEELWLMMLHGSDGSSLRLFDFAVLSF